MTAEIFLRRPHCGVPWGFRLIGGSDSHLPIIVSKVIEGSVAEKAGLEEDVVLERVNNVPTSGLTHAEVNQIILAAQEEVLFTIRRVNLEHLILASLNEEEDNSEISNILRQSVTKGEIIEEDEFQKLGLQKEFGVTMIIDNNNKNIQDNRKNEEITKNHKFLENQSTRKKWSTFLQKPNNPKPKPKNQPPPVPKSDQYKVIITKQPKPTFKPKEIPQQENKIEDKKETVPEKIEETLERTEEVPMELEIMLKTHVTEETEVTIEDAEENVVQLDKDIDLIENIEEENSGDVEKEEEAYSQEYESSEIEKISTDVIIENPAEHSMSLEKQLAEVQKQLQELAQLPSSIQETLAVVTQQLASIVNEKTSTTLEKKEETDDKQESNEMGDNEETDNINIDSSEELEVRVHTEEEAADDEKEDISDKAEMEDVQSDVLSDICEEQEISETVDEVSQSERMLAEQEKQRIEEEKQAKHQLEIQEEENRKKYGAVRPIILPGGRKWVDPDDVVVKVKNPKMTDEKISDTLETFSEVIVGKTKGINFLKYTPPPKNLEYLQRSDVYRLVHGMEPPVRGISLRAEKILAAQDYYTAGGN